MTTPPQAPPECYFFGCWNAAGHYLFLPNGEWPSRKGRKTQYHQAETFGADIHIDGALAPRIHERTGKALFVGSVTDRDERRSLEYRSEECPQGQFLHHELDNGFTAIQWWDRCQGDKRGACNSTVLLKGKHTSVEMLAALAEYFPHVLANLNGNGVQLVEVTL